MNRNIAFDVYHLDKNGECTLTIHGHYFSWGGCVTPDNVVINNIDIDYGNTPVFNVAPGYFTENECMAWKTMIADKANTELDQAWCTPWFLNKQAI